MSWSERYNVTDIDNELFVPELSLYKSRPYCKHYYPFLI
jgi:hypothetical protein